MRFGILGPLQVTDGSQPVALAQGRQRLLLSVLLLHANEAVSADRLIDALWGESPPPTAGRSLHNLVSALRKALGEGVLVTEGHGYRLNVADGDCFADRVDEGRAALASGDSAKAATLLRDALELWRGPAFADLAYEPAVADEAVRLEELRLSGLEERIDADLALGRHADVTPELERLVAEHPLRERLAGQQMLALYRSGRQADALRVFADTRRRLVEELGIEPGPALRRIEQAVLEQDPGLGTPDALPPPPARRRRGTPRPAVLAGAGAAVVAAAVAALLLAGGSGPHATGLGRLAGDTAVGVDARAGRVVAAVPLGGTPTSVAVGAGAVWALNADDRTVARIDPGTGHVRTVGVSATPTDLAADAGGVWVGARGQQFGTAHVIRLDESLAIRADIRLPGGTHEGAGGAPGQMATSAGALWVINDGEDLERVDARTARVTATARPLRARAVAASGTDVWALPSDATAVVRVDARTAAVRRRIRLPTAELDAIATGDGVVWATDAYDGTLWRIDPGGTVLTRTIPVGAGADGVSVGQGAVWVINSLRGTLTRVDPRTNRITRTIALGNTPRDVTEGAGQVWVTLAGEGASLPAAVAGHGGPRPLPAAACGRVLTVGRAAPDVLIASDNPLQTPPEFDVQPVANAVEFVLREHHFRAGRFRVGYQSCDSSTANSAQSDPGKCQSNAKAYADDPAVVGVVGAYNSGCTLLELPILNRAPGGPVAVISPSNSLIALTHRDTLQPRDSIRHLYPTGIRNFARVYPADDAEATVDALLARRLGLRHLFVLDDGSPPGIEIAFHVRRVARLIGLAIAGAARWDATGAGFRRLVSRVRRAGADGVLLSGVSGTNGGRLVHALRSSPGRRLVLIGPNPFSPVDFLFDESHGAITGMYLSNPGVQNSRLPAPGKSFVRAFTPTQHTGHVRNLAVYAAAATEALLDAIARSDGTRASVTRRLLSTRLRDSVVGPLSFDRNGDTAVPVITIMRVKARSGISDIPAYEGAAIDRVITPPPRLIR